MHEIIAGKSELRTSRASHICNSPTTSRESLGICVIPQDSPKIPMSPGASRLFLAKTLSFQEFLIQKGFLPSPPPPFLFSPPFTPLFPGFPCLFHAEEAEGQKIPLDWDFPYGSLTSGFKSPGIDRGKPRKRRKPLQSRFPRRIPGELPGEFPFPAVVPLRETARNPLRKDGHDRNYPKRSKRCVREPFIGNRKEKELPR